MPKMCMIEGEKTILEDRMLRELGAGPDRDTEFLVPRERACLQPWLWHSVLQGPVAQLTCPTLSWLMEQWNTQHSPGE